MDTKNTFKSGKSNIFLTPSFLIITFLVAIILGLIIMVCQRGGESVEVESFTPLDEVPLTTNFTVTFSRELVSDSLLNKWKGKAPIEFSPSIPGNFQWIKRDKIRFYPHVILAPSTEYTAEIKSEIASQFGYKLKGERRFQFHTPKFHVNNATLSFEFSPEKEKKIRLTGTVEFNYEVLPDEALKHLEIRFKDGGELPFQLVTSKPASILALETDWFDRDKKQKEIQLRVSAGLLPVGGNTGLEEDFAKSILLKKLEDLKVERVFVVRESPKRRHIRIQFNQPVDEQQAKQFIEISPSLPIKFRSTYHYLNAIGNFKIGKAYKIFIRKGLSALSGAILKKEFSTTISFRKENIPPQIDFVGEGFYLTKSGHLNIGLSTINVDQVTIEIEKVFANNLIYLLNENDPGQEYGYFWYNVDALGKKVTEKDMIIQKIENEEVVTPINIKELLKDRQIGIFNITARYSRQRWIYTSKWVMATDMGIVAKRAGDDLWVWVNSLKSLKPVKNAEVKLISQNNQILGTKRTNEDGVAIFNDLRAIEKEFTPYLITAAFGEDLCFLELTRRKIPTSDFNVDGEPVLKHGYSGYVYGERGVYRPGEVVHLAAVVRGENMSVPAPFPVVLQIKDPEGKIFSEQRAKLNRQGAADFSVSVPHYARTGIYTALLLVGESDEIGRTEFNVEEFVPDRMKVKLTTDKESYQAGERMLIQVEAMTLFGPPASGRRVEANIEIEEYPFSPEPWKSFNFKDEKKSFTKQHFSLGEQVLDLNGKYQYNFDLPDRIEAPSSLRGIISTTVLEPGGRGVSSYRSVMIHPYENYIGLRMANEGYAQPNKNTDIEFIVLNNRSEIVPNRKLSVTLYRVYWHSILKKITSTGRYRYVSEQVEEQVQSLEVTSEGKISKFSVLPEEYGKYIVVVRDPLSGASSSLSFYASGWGYSPWAMDQPDRIELDLDKGSYLPGQTAKLQIRAPFTGKLLITIERDKIFSYQVVELTENTATVDLLLSESYKPNVYVSAHLIRSTESLDRDTPVRAFGIIPLQIDNRSNRLVIELNVPEEIRPNKKLTVRYKIKDSNARQAFVTIAAVDEGICQLTDFQTPDPYDYFFGKKRLGVETFDIYSLILPEIESSLSSPSGGMLEARRKKHISPVNVTRVKPVAFWSGLVSPDGSGRGAVKFQIPQFNGTVRIMAVAFIDDKFGSNSKKIFVREPIVMTPTFPRFVASEDEFYVPVSVYNGTGSASDFNVKLSAQGAITIKDEALQKIRIEKGNEGVVYFHLKAGKTIGKLKFKLTATGGGEKAVFSVEVPLRPSAPFTTLSDRGSVTAGKSASFTFPANWVKGTAEFFLSISAFPVVRFTQSLQYLLSYPYGCIEQTTSKLFPLLYFKDLAKIAEPELFETNSAEYFIEEGISKLERLQQESGAFSYWPEGDYVNNWSSIYASHFLVEARKAGYLVSDRVYKKMIGALRTFSREYRNDDVYSLQTAVYACYVLSLAGKPERSTMLYLKNNLSDKLKSFSLYQLAGAFAYAGDLQTAKKMLPASVSPIDQTKKRETGGNFNSQIRAKAIMLDVLSEVDETNPAVPVLVEILTKAASEKGRWYTTQENAFAFLALGKILKKQSRGNYTGTLSIDGKKYEKFAMENYQFSAKDWAGKKVTISIKGEGTCYFSWCAEGIPASMNIDEYDRGLIVRRFYLNEQGIPVNNRSFKQGDLVIAKITIKSVHESLDNVAVIDMLPAGFEIENPRLQSRQGIDWISGSNYQPLYLDIRDDRLILFGNFSRGREETFYYGLRAVTRGKFHLPSVRAEAMYAPEKASVASSGIVEIQSQ